MQNGFEGARGRFVPRVSLKSSHSSFYRSHNFTPLKMCPVPLPCAQDSISTHARGHAAPQLPRKFTASANVYLRFPRSHKRLARGIRRWTRLIEHERNIRKTRYFPSVGICDRAHPRLRRQQLQSISRRTFPNPNSRAFSSSSY